LIENFLLKIIEKNLKKLTNNVSIWHENIAR